MRWPKKPWQPVRTRRRFLLLPKLIRQEWRWLETASWSECYSTDYSGSGWVALAWLD